MSDQPPPPPPPNPEHLLQWEIQRAAADALRHALPPPIVDTPENRIARDQVALSKVTAMIPANPAEVELAAAHVAAMAHYFACLREAAEFDTAAPDLARKCRAQAASMSREARGLLGRLERMQAIRGKREANPEDCNSAHWTEHCLHGGMTQALASLPPQAPPRPPPPPAARPAAEPAAAKPKWAPLRDYNDWTPEEKARERLRGEAGRYAVLNPVRVKQIRKLGGLPPDCDYEPPRPEVLHEIIHGNGSNLRWADTYEPYVMPEAEAKG